MRPEDRYRDARYLRQDQYRDAGNLGARAALHGRFSTNPHDWYAWVCDHLQLAPGISVLECGCGPGWQWRKTLDCLPPNVHLTLTDLSGGMVKAARAKLAAAAQTILLGAANIQSLPFAADQFDLVVANHMLYHVADREKAFAEVRRVLRKNGRFVAATNGLNHLLELRTLYGFLGLDWRVEGLTDAFSLENGRKQLRPWFKEVTLELYPDSLAVTEVEPLLAYVLSSSEARAAATPERLSQLRDHVTAVIEAEGAFRVQKATGLFIATQPRRP